MKQVLVNIAQLATCPADHPQSDAGLIDDAALVIEDGKVAWAGATAALPRAYGDYPRHDCEGRLATPGLIDCHTHLCFAGWRAEEFEMRLAGHSYLDIQAAGGGINSTVRQTRGATASELLNRAAEFLDRMLSLGVTAVEAKSGYGLDLENEIKQLEIYAKLNGEHPIDLVPTVLGAHVLPPEYAEDRNAYVDLLCERLLPEVAARGLARYCDVFVEQGAFQRHEARRILERARELGLGAKVHADQLGDGGGATLAADVRAVSAEHLEHVSDAGISDLAAAGVVAVSLPLASLYLGEPYLPARKLIGKGVAVAVATDFNPGSAPSFHLPLALLLACLRQSMTPQESLMGATAIAARAVGLEKTHGSLTAGRRADLALFDAPSLNQWLYHFQANACRAVMKAGEWVHVAA